VAAGQVAVRQREALVGVVVHVAHAGQEPLQCVAASAEIESKIEAKLKAVHHI
jgi:hypothetical protein